MLIDTGLVLYVGLFTLFLWRFICWWRCCGRWLQYANYCSLLLGLLLVILGYNTFEFVQACLQKEGKAAWDDLPLWLKPMMLSVPGVAFAIYGFCSIQTFYHVEQIREGSAVQRHDRAVQIILLPAVYSAMAMSSFTRIYLLFCDPAATAKDTAMALARSESSFWVGDLYEAWVLYQFGELTLEVIKSEFVKQGGSVDHEERVAAGALLATHSAVSSLAWLGILSFLIVCVAQAGWSLWLLTFAYTTNTDYEASVSQFTLAGFLASCGAIYNVYIVESQFHRYLARYSPFLKFITVKVLVSFAFVQRYFFKGLNFVHNNLPEVVKSFSNKTPVLGTIVNFNQAQFEIFYATLIVFECLLLCLAHCWAWSSSESWYDEDDEDEEERGLEASGPAYGAATSQSKP